MNEKDPKENVDDMHWRDATKDEIVELKKMFDIDDKIADHIRIIVDKDDNITEDTKKFMKVLKCNQKAHIHRLELLNQQKTVIIFSAILSVYAGLSLLIAVSRQTVDIFNFYNVTMWIAFIITFYLKRVTRLIGIRIDEIKI